MSAPRIERELHDMRRNGANPLEIARMRKYSDEVAKESHQAGKRTVKFEFEGPCVDAEFKPDPIAEQEQVISTLPKGTIYIRFPDGGWIQVKTQNMRVSRPWWSHLIRR